MAYFFFDQLWVYLGHFSHACIDMSVILQAEAVQKNFFIIHLACISTSLK